MRAPLLWLAPALALTATAQAASPTLTDVVPRGGQRGTELTVTLRGDRLADAEGLLFDGPGFEVRGLKARNAKVVEVMLAIAADCRLGEHGLRVRCKSGLSELRTFWVGALPQVEEKEPNDDLARAQAVPLDVTLEGVLTGEDRDLFAFDGRAGQRVTAEVEAMRLGGPVLDARLRLLDAAGAEVAACDDAPLLGQDAALAVALPADGRYVVEVHEATWQGSGRHRYRLHLGTFPRPLVAFPPTTTHEALALLGDAAPVGTDLRLLRGVAAPDGTAPLLVETSTGVTPSPVQLAATPHPTAVEVEPNDRRRATVVTLPAALAGCLERPGDQDWFRFTAKKGQRLRLRAFARALGSPADPVLDLYVAGGRRLAGNDDAQGRPDSDFAAAIPEDGEYELRVRDFLEAGGPLHVYAVEVAPAEPALSLDLQTYGRNSQARNALIVPRGNRMAVLVRVTREGAGGPVIVDPTHLPAGTAAIDTAVCADGIATVPLVLEAAADAPLAGALVGLTARLEKQPDLTGSLGQRVVLTFGAPNNAVYWTRTLERLAVAVAEPVPFRVRLVEPRAPLVRDGIAELEVVVEREAGFDKPVIVSLLQDSPNTSSRKEVRVEPGRDRATIAVTANGRAALGSWPLVVVAHADAGQGQLWASSQVARLEVAPPLVRLELTRAAGAQGTTIDLAAEVHVDRPFEGEATARLVGLPPHVTAPALTFRADAKALRFPLTIGAAARVGRHRQVQVELLVPHGEAQVLHRPGATELRVDPPAAASAPPPPPTTEAPRSRLEQLRAEHAARKARAQAQGDQP